MADFVGSDQFATSSPPGQNSGTTARVRADGARLGMDYTPLVRTRAIKAAGRHTARVKFLKRAILIGAILAAVTTALVAVFNPFRHLPTGVSLSGVGVSGTKITMHSPKLSGVQQGGGPYSIRSTTGIQDITQPSIIELVGVDADVGMADGTMSQITSAHGVYDSRADAMTLNGRVKIVNKDNYTLNLESAAIDFRAGILASHERLKVEIQGGDVFADDLSIANNGHVIAFRGHVSSTFTSSDDGAGPPEPAQADAP